MIKSLVLPFLLAATAAVTLPGAVRAQPAAKPNDAQIAHVAYTADQIDIAAGKQALKRSKNRDVRAFAQEMVRDHTAVNKQALSFVKKLHVTPEANSISAALSKQASEKLKEYSRLRGAAFDRAYAANEVVYHKAVNSALSDTLIPSAQNPELKALLETGLKLFQEHEQHAEQMVGKLP